MRMIISERGCLICLSKLIPNSPNLDSNSKRFKFRDYIIKNEQLKEKGRIRN